MRRLKQNWIDTFVGYLSPVCESPENYLFWSAAVILAASLKRRVWVDRRTYKLYPNIYCVLVGHAGVGKGSAINPAVTLLKEAGTANIISDRVTIEYVLEKLSKGFPVTNTTPQGGVSFATDASALITAPELQVFATASQHTLPILADLWDTREQPFDYGTKTQGKFLIHKPTVSLLGGSTTEWLVDALPQTAIGGGFTRRVNFVYAKAKSRSIPWPAVNSSKILDDIVEDLRYISTLTGEMTWAPDARPVFEKVYKESEATEYDDEATAAYKTTKWAHAAKLATVLSLADSDSRVITKTQLERAVAAVEEVEATIGLVFRSVGESDLVAASDRVLRFLENKGLASRSDILRANWRHLSNNDLDVILATMMQAGMIAEKNTGHKVLYEAVVQTKRQP